MTAFLAAVMAKKTVNGLRLEWIVPADRRPVDLENFVEYAINEEHRVKLIERGQRCGWTLVP